jgi:hypothetical protein
MRRRREIGKEIRYYYNCGGYIDSEFTECSRHTVKSEEKLFSVVKKAIKHQIKLFLEIDRILEKDKGINSEKIKKFDLNIYKQRKITMSLAVKKSDIYKDYSEGILTKDEYLSYKKSYSLKYDSENNKLEELIFKTNEFKKIFIEKELIEKIKKIDMTKSLNKEMIETFIDKVYYYENGKYEISLNYRDEYEYILDELGIDKVRETCLK